MKKFISFLIIFFAVGCSKYHSPKISTPSSSRSGIVFENSNQDLRQFAWWKKMNDPVLDQLIQQTLARNNQLMVARHQVLQAEAQLKSAQYQWIPTLNTQGTGYFGHVFNTDVTPEGNSTIAPQNNSSSHLQAAYGSLAPSYSLNILSNISESNYAKASLEKQKAYVNAIKLTLISQTASAYFKLLGLHQQYQLQKALIKDWQDIRALQENRLQEGKSDWAAVYAIDNQIHLNEANLPFIENSTQETENAIRTLTNQFPGSVMTTKSINNLFIKGIIPPRLPSGVLKNRPDILMAENQLKMAHANVRLAQSYFFPIINLTSYIGGASLSLSNIVDFTTNFWTNQLNAAIPILNLSSYEDIKSAKEGYSMAYYQYMDTVKQAFTEVDNALTNYAKINQQYQITQKTVQDTQRLYKIAVNQYQEGLANYQNVLQKKIDWDSAQINLIQIRMQQLDSIVSVYQAVAGGYAS